MKAFTATGQVKTVQCGIDHCITEIGRTSLTGAHNNSVFLKGF